jgi:hypothetical protein
LLGDLAADILADLWPQPVAVADHSQQHNPDQRDQQRQAAISVAAPRLAPALVSIAHFFPI